MKQIRSKTLLAMAAITALLLSGCTKEPAVETLGEGVQLCLSIDGQQSPSAASAPATRATAVDESAVNNVWVLQFQMTAGSTTEGTLVRKTYIATVTDLAKIKYLPAAGSNMMVYLVANTGNSSLFSSTAEGATLAAVKATTVSVTATDGKNFPAAASTNLPMVGQSAHLTLPTSTAVAVTLTRTAAKVALTVKNLLTEGYPRLIVTSVQLKNIANCYPTQIVNAASGFTGTSYYPAASAGKHTSYTAIAGDITAAGTTSTYYLAPNVRGIGTATDERLKSDATAASGQGAYCTYVEILGTAKASVYAPEVDVCYRLYLGGNNTNDFNLHSNTAYKVDVELTGVNAADARMRITTDKFDLMQGGTEGDNPDDIWGWSEYAKLFYGDAANNGGVTTSLQGSTTSSYNSYTIGSNGTRYATYTDAYAGEKGYYKLEVASSVEQNAYGALQQTWMGAMNACKAKTTDGGGWRLPRLSEVRLILLNKSSLEKTFGFTAFPGGGGLWAGTECNDGNAWYIAMSGGVSSASKTNGTYYRCVRELPTLPAVGDYYYSDGSLSSKVESGKTVNGVIYWVDAAHPSKFKVMALDESSTTATPKPKWAAKNTYVIGSDAWSPTDGRGNAAAIKAAFDNRMAGVAITESTFGDAFPAAAYCYNYTGKDLSDPKGTWYLPTKNDLQHLYCAYNGAYPVFWGSGSIGAPAINPTAQATWNGLLTSAGGTGVSIDGAFWSGIEASHKTSDAWGVGFGNVGYTYFSIKTSSSYFVRCVRDL